MKIDRIADAGMPGPLTLVKFGVAVALSAAAVWMAGCRSDMAAVQQAPIVDGNAAADPANVNMAQPVAVAGAAPVFDAAQAARNGYAPRYAASSTRVAGESYSAPQQAYAENYPAQSVRQTRSEAYNYNTQQPAPYDGDDDQLYGELLDTNVPIAQQPPPPLPQYEQPVAPGPDYLWTPGYWNYANAGYYYVPGNWVSAPFVGALWTPGWWGYTGRGYGWHRGYWGRHVGYYGGVNYGFGFIGIGYQGGYWNNDHFQYNRDCNHVDPRAVNNYVYERNVTVTNNTYVNNTRVSYNGGPGGLERRPQPAEFAAAREAHIAPLPAQVAERQAASQNRQQFFNTNGGRPQQMFAAHPVIERNVNVPAQLARAQALNNGAALRPAGNNAQPGFNNGGNTPQFRPQHGAPQGQRQLANQPYREQMQRAQQQPVVQQQIRQQQETVQQAREQQMQQGNLHAQQVQQGNQVRLQEDQQRMQVNQMRRQQQVQQQTLRLQQDNQQRAQQQARVQQNQQEQQRAQLQVRQQQNQQRAMQPQVRQQQDQERSAQQQVRQQQEQQRSFQPQQQPQRLAQPQQQRAPEARAPQPHAQPAAAPRAENPHEHGR